MDLATFRPICPWGHDIPAIDAEQLVSLLAKETADALANYSALPIGPFECERRSGYSRLSIEIPLSEALFDQLMNGPSGYRAHYAAGVKYGEAFNRILVDTIAPLVVAAEDLYADKFDRQYCQRSLLGTFSKFWYTGSLTDPSARDLLLRFKEELLVRNWKTFWSNHERPRKGLLAPIPEQPAVLLNGTFVDDTGAEFDQKPRRSQELYERGWT